MSLSQDLSNYERVHSAQDILIVSLQKYKLQKIQAALQQKGYDVSRKKSH